MKRWLLPPVAAALSVSLFAQGVIKEASGAEAAAAKKDYLALSAEFNKEFCDYMSGMAKVQKSEAYQKAVKAFRAARREGGDGAAERAAITKMMPKAPNSADYIPRFRDAAKKHANSPVAAEFLTWILMNARRDRDAAKFAVTTLADKHLSGDSAYMLAVNARRWGNAVGVDNAVQVLNKIIKTSNNKEAQHEAIYSRAMLLRRSRNASEEDKAAAAEAFEKLKKEAPDSTPVLRMNGKTFAKERLQIGMVAPDASGVDIDGVKFSISDYRGKVVVIDFWGDW